VLKKLFALSLVMGLLAVTTGCPSKDKDKKTGSGKTGSAGTGGSGTTGGTGRTEDTEKPKEAKLELEQPKDVTIKQGGEATIDLKVMRTNTEENLAVKFDNLPKGITMKEAKAEIPGDKSEATFTFKAADDTKTGTTDKASVTVTDATGKLKPSRTFKLVVEKK